MRKPATLMYMFGSKTLFSVLLCGLTVLVVKRTVCYFHRRSWGLLDDICYWNNTVENALLLAKNQARFARSLIALREYSRIDSYCSIFPATCKGKSAPLADVKERTTERNLQSDSIGMQRILKTFASGLAISFVTTNVTGYRGQYLSQSVAKMLAIVSHGSRLKNEVPIYFSICNVDPRPEGNQEMKNLPKWIPVHNRFNSKRKLTIEDATNTYDKAKNDYVFCLEKTLETHASYVLLMEDDALAMDNLLHVLSHFIYSHRKLSTDETHEPLLENLTYLKLYFPVHQSGYIDKEPERILELISISVVLTALVLRVATFWKPRLRVSSNSMKIVFVLFLLVVQLVGRNNIIELRRVSERLFYLTPAPRGSMVAVLYPRQGALDIIRYLPSITCNKELPKDLAIGDIVNKYGLTARLVQPNLFEHIGHYSSVHQKLHNPFQTN